MKKRKASVLRRTRETDISVKLDIDGRGNSKIGTGIGFLDHMLELFAFHGLFDLVLKAKGDLNVDLHHTNEDVGIAVGEAFKKALGNKKSGIRRFGSAFVPMDEALALVVVDISGRPNLTLDISRISTEREKRKKEYTLNDAKQLLKAFSDVLGVTLHIQIISGENTHHILESIFKALGRALDDATQPSLRKGVPSTKGRI